jgi:GTPase SAR1 family protein
MNNYKVVILGASGSGKTVFLASMFHELSTQGNRGFFLKAEGVNKPRLLYLTRS